MTPVAQGVRDRLRTGAAEYLQDLRADVLQTAAGGYDPAGSAKRR